MAGIAAVVTIAHIMASFGILHLYSLVHAALLLLAIFFLARRGGLSLVKRALNDGGRTSGRSFGFTAAVLAAAAAYAIPTFSTAAPNGWDPSFHSILAQKILLSGGLARDWLPFEEIGVNYSLGSHVLIAIIAKLSGCPVHHVIQVLHMLVQIPAVILIHAVAARIFRNETAAAAAMVCYAFLCNFGSFFSYYQWGGIPTEIGALFFLGIVWTLERSRSGKSLALAVLLFGSMIMAHNLSALIYASVMGLHVLNNARRLGKERLAAAFLKLAAFTFIAYSFYIVPYVLKGAGLFETSVLKFYDEEMITLPVMIKNLGVIATACGAAGVVIAVRSQDDSMRRFLFCWLAAPLLGFTLLDYVYRLGAVIFFRDNFSAFTPSRFLTALAYPLAIYAGFAIERAIASLSKAFPDMKIAQAAGAPAVSTILTLAAALIISAPEVLHVASQSGFSEDTRELGEIVKNATPPNAFVIYPAGIEKKHWLPYLAWRQTVYTPLPASEKRLDARIVEKHGIFMPENTIRAVREWVLEKKDPGYLVVATPRGSAHLVRIK